jgi:hypothetical protein
VNDRETQRSKGFGFLEFATSGAPSPVSHLSPCLPPSTLKPLPFQTLTPLPPPSLAVDEAKAALAHLATVTMQGRLVVALLLPPQP